MSEDQSHQNQFTEFALSNPPSLPEARAAERGEEPIKIPRLELIIVGKTGRECSSVHHTIVASLWMWLVRHFAECWRISLSGEALLIAPRGRVTDRNEDRQKLSSFPYTEGESCRSRLGDALSPGKDFEFHYVRRLSARLGRNVTLGTSDSVVADRPATFEFRP